MTHINSVFAAFIVARQHLFSLFFIHFTFRLLSLAVIGPAIGIVFALAIQLSDQKALTDMDIAAFLLSPAGFIVSIFVFSLVLAAAFLDFTAMTFALFQREKRAIAGVRRGFGFVAANSLGLVWFCSGLIVRILGIATPFLALAALIAFNSLTEFDINYYLTYWPPEFVKAVGIIGILLAIMMGVLLFFLAGWGISLHLFLVRKLSVREAFRESRRLLEGKRFGLVLRVVIWAAIRILLLAVVALFFTKLTAVLLDNAVGNLRFMAGILLIVFGVWGLIYMFATTLTTGSLVELLLQTYVKATNTEITPSAPDASSMSPLKIPLWGIVVAALGVFGLGLFSTGALLERFSKVPQVDIIAHRGAANLRPENTMAAIEKALDDGTDWVEIDVQESAEGELIIAHDSDFMKLANKPLKTWEATRVDLDKIDIGTWFDPQYSSERTPLLRDVLEAAKGRAKVVIELKYYGHDVNIESEVVRIVEEEGMEGDVSLMSLKYSAVQKLNALRPQWRTGVLAAKSIGDVAQLEADFLALNAGQISRNLIVRAHSQGKDVYAWTVDDPVQMSSLITMGVDGLITNDPALARIVLDHSKNLSAAERLVLWLADFIQLSPLELVVDGKDA